MEGTDLRRSGGSKEIYREVGLSAVIELVDLSPFYRTCISEIQDGWSLGIVNEGFPSSVTLSPQQGG
jgi:hypothetical protein